MALTMILTGDVNLMNVTDATVPFARVADELHEADVVFSNLECCLVETPLGHSVGNEGFFADPDVGGEALQLAGIHAVGIANNVHYGDANIMASVARLDELGIPHAGAGKDLASARAPVILDRGGVRFGFLQRSSVYWPTNHEAHADATGIAVIRGHTAYQVPTFKTRPEIPPPNRPGVPPEIVTWADAAYLGAFTDDVAALRPRVDILVASFHWGLRKDVLDYMAEIAHAAIDAGADIVMGHGPHYSLPVGMHRARRSSTGSATCRSTPATADASTATGSACWCAPTSGATASRTSASASCGTRTPTRPTGPIPTRRPRSSPIWRSAACVRAKLMRNGHEMRVGPA